MKHETTIYCSVAQFKILVVGFLLFNTPLYAVDVACSALSSITCNTPNHPSFEAAFTAREAAWEASLSPNRESCNDWFYNNSLNPNPDDDWVLSGFREYKRHGISFRHGSIEIPSQSCTNGPSTNSFRFTVYRCRADRIYDPDIGNGVLTNASCVSKTCPEGTIRNDFGICECPEGQVPNENGMCVADPKNNGNPCPWCPPTPNPIHPGTGNKYQIESDYTGSGAYPLTLQRYYNSLLPTNGNMGSHWRSSYSQSLVIQPGNTEVTVIRPDAKEYTFTLSGSDWVPDADVVDQLVELLDGSSVRIGWTYTTSNDTVETYSVDGKLLSLTRRDGLTQTLAYDVAAIDGGDDNPDTLDTVTDPAGRTLTFSYDANGRVSTMTDPAGEVYSYTYDTNDNLVSVTYPDETPGDNNDNPQRIYHYEDTNFPNALTGITDENNNRYATYAYDAQGRAISSEHAGGAIRVDATYNPDGTTTVTDSLGNIQTQHFTILHGVVKTTEVEGEQCANCGQFQNTTYDANGFIASRTDFNGNVTNYTHDARGLETSRTEAVGTPEERTITIQWHATFRLPVQITEPGQITTFTYDAQGRLLTREVSAP